MQMNDGTMRKLDSAELRNQIEMGREDLIFEIGEHVKIKGGDFRIKSIGKKMMVLEGLPGTRIKN